MLEAASLQAVAHGSDSVMYFQIRKGRGGFEKFHGAVIDHYGKDDDRTYRECCEVGQDLLCLEECNHTDVKADVAVVYDWENRWAVEESKGPRNKGMFYKETVLKSYAAFRKQGLNVDLVDMEKSLDGYRIVAAPMLYMFRAGFEKKVRKFVELGGTFIMTYWSGVVDENDLCVLGGTPGGLMDVMGLRSTEIDALYDGESNRLIPAEGSRMAGEYTCRNLCQLVDATTAESLMVYGEEFYQGTSALTVNRYGEGTAYYVCADAEQSFYDDLYRMLCADAGIRGPLSCPLPEGVEVTTREGRNAEFIFIQNYAGGEVKLPVSVKAEGYEVIFRSREAAADEEIILQRFNTVVLKKIL